ncbi:hypothetical protein T484DRAFT_1798248 [Baffinella frigidus]|nr:hypothetical protein T484DRAFT_1798248 [Cryptophyta sp. CCMP2293]
MSHETDPRCLSRSWKWESQSLPCFSPRLSPYPSPPATPYSSRSRSPSSFRAASPAQDPFTTRSRSPTTDRSSHSSLSGAETLGVVAHPAANQAASLPIPPPPAALNFMFAPFGGSGAGKNPSPHQHRAGVAGLSSIEDGEGIDAAPIVGSPPPAAERSGSSWEELGAVWTCEGRQRRRCGASAWPEARSDCTCVEITYDAFVKVSSSGRRQP